MTDSQDRELELLLRRLAEVPVGDVPSHVRPGIVLADRLEIEHQLGAGGMGRVFAAFDRVRRGRVAVKVLGRLSPRSIVQLKREFRAVAELVHPNLARCHELSSDGPEWFFTMELVDGVTLSTFLARDAGDPPWDALRDVLRQLATALRALHEAHLLHGDLKPSNFLVTTGERRVVLLDFGLTRPFGLVPPGEEVIGTTGYLAPEQLRDDPLTEAVDWFAFGVVLHHALTGALPTGGPSAALLEGKPPDLVRLCRDLLSPRPTDRPGGREVLRRIGSGGAPAAAEPPALARATLVGREAELDALEDAFGATLRGRPALAVVTGPSGIGKSSLVAAFVERVRARGGLAVGGGCRERESMAYKAVDALVDDLVRTLDGLPPEEAAALLPEHLPELTVLFPALRAARVVAAAPAELSLPLDHAGTRLRAIAAFGELLAGLRRRAPLVVWIDDLQWSDPESALLLGPVLGGPAPVPLLLVVACRDGAAGAPSADVPEPLGAPAASAPLLAALLADRNLALPRPAAIPVPPLRAEAALRLALELLPPDAHRARAEVRHIAEEAGGNPLHVVELAHAVAQDDGAGSMQAPATLQELVVRRVVALPPLARRVLELVAVSGAPLPRSVLWRTKALTFVEGEASLDLLRARRLVRTHGLREEDAVDVHHDRIREIVLQGLDEARRRTAHLRLARVLEGRPETKPDLVAIHYEAAGEPRLASRHWLAAAERAARALAFDRAAELYGRALREGLLEPEAARGVQLARAEALGRAGKGPAAADVFLAVAEGSPREDALELRRRAAEQLLYSGHLDAGIEVIEQVLRAVGMRGTRSGAAGLLSFVAGRARVRLRGLRYRPRAERELSPEERLRLDASWNVAGPLGPVDFIRGADFQNEHLLLALDAGEPRRLLRALILEVSYSATPGVGSARRTARLLAMVDDLARADADEAATALLSVVRGMVAYLRGRLRHALAALEGALDLLERLGGRRSIEAVTAQRFVVATLFFLGRFRRLGEFVPPLLAEAEGTGNVYATLCFRTGYATAVWLARDDVREARRQTRRAREEWSARGFQLAHVNMLIAETYADLYAGDVELARARLVEAWPRIRDAHLLRIGLVREQLLLLRAATGAAAADAAAARGRRVHAATLRRDVLADARRLRRGHPVRSAPGAALTEAALAWADGEGARARRLLDGAAAAFERQGMDLYAAAARIRAGERTGGADGAALARAGYAVLAREGIVSPARLVGMLAPGFGDAAPG